MHCVEVREEVGKKRDSFFCLVVVDFQEFAVYTLEYPLSVLDISVCYPSEGHCLYWTDILGFFFFCYSLIHFFLLRYFLFGVLFKISFFCFDIFKQAENFSCYQHIGIPLYAAVHAKLHRICFKFGFENIAFFPPY